MLFLHCCKYIEIGEKNFDASEVTLFPPFDLKVENKHSMQSWVRRLVNKFNNRFHSLCLIHCIGLKYD